MELLLLLLWCREIKSLAIAIWLTTTADPFLVVYSFLLFAQQKDNSLNRDDDDDDDNGNGEDDNNNYWSNMNRSFPPSLIAFH